MGFLSLGLCPIMARRIPLTWGFFDPSCVPFGAVVTLSLLIPTNKSGPIIPFSPRLPPETISHTLCDITYCSLWQKNCSLWQKIVHYDKKIVHVPWGLRINSTHHRVRSVLTILQVALYVRVLRLSSHLLPYPLRTRATIREGYRPY